MPADADEMPMGVTAFKARCLALIDDVARGKTRRVVRTPERGPACAPRYLRGDQAHERRPDRLPLHPVS
jgi:hypothetical protein